MEWRKAPNGVIPCDDIWVNDEGDVEGIYIFNHHMGDFEKLSTYFTFEVEEFAFTRASAYEDLECTSP